MARIYEKYPEIIFFDATAKLNNLDLGLFVQLCMDDMFELRVQFMSKNFQYRNLPLNLRKENFQLWRNK